MANTNTVFSLESVKSGEGYLRHKTFAEVQYDLEKCQLGDVVVGAMRTAYDEIVENKIDEFEDYQRAAVVSPTNTARIGIYSVLPAFYGVLGCITPEEIEHVKVNFYALAGGKQGLYLVCDVIGLRGIEYRYQYPEIKEAPSEEDRVTYTFTANGGYISKVETIAGQNMTVDEYNDKTTITEEVNGLTKVYHVRPMELYKFTSFAIDDNLYTDFKTINDLDGITIGETKDGYEVSIVSTTEDSHNFVFTCSYDAEIVQYSVLISTYKCKSALRHGSAILTPGASPITFVSGDYVDVTFTPDLYTELAAITIDGRDYLDEYVDGGMYEYKGHTADGKEFSISITEDKLIGISIPHIGMDHEIYVAFAAKSYRIKGIGIYPDGSTTSNIFERSMTYDESYEITADLLFPDYNISRVVTRDVDGKVIASDKIMVDFSKSTGVVSISRTSCDAIIYVYLEDKPKTCIITGECVHCGIQYLQGEASPVTKSNIVTEPILYGNSAVFRIVASAAYRFSTDRPTFGAIIKIDGADVDPIYLESNDIELVRISDEMIALSFLSLAGDHTFRIELTDDNRRPDYTVTFTGTNVVNKAEDEENEEAVESYDANVIENMTVTRVYVPAEGYVFPADISPESVPITVNGIALGAFTYIPIKVGNAYVAVSIESDAISVTVSDITGNSSVNVTLPEENKIVPKYNVNVIATYATVEGDNPSEAAEGSDKTIIIHADPGTTFENVMFILDKESENESKWVIDMDTDSFNIFDREVEGVPQIENDGKVIRSRDGDHYDYTVYLKDIRNDYEIRFSTITIGT